MPAILPLSLQDDAYLGAMFAWQARVGAGPVFGSRPIGWHQIHHCHVLDLITATGAKGIRYRKGILEIYQDGPTLEWTKWTTPLELFRKADDLSRR